MRGMCLSTIFFFIDTATTDFYTLSLHDALPISTSIPSRKRRSSASRTPLGMVARPWSRSEEHTSELQSRRDLGGRLLLEKKKTQTTLLLVVKMKLDGRGVIVLLAVG